MTRILPPWSVPTTLNGEVWKTIVQHQMFAKIFRDVLIMQILQLKWKVQTRDPADKTSQRENIKRFTRIIEAGDDDEGYLNTMDRLLQDVLDIPFGGALELVPNREELEEVANIDGTTLRPTYDYDFPVVQIVQAPLPPVMLARDEVARLYLSPHSSIKRRGWGMAPPERVYLGLELLGRGDKYYANLMLDTPPAGILDLMDMSQDTAMEWASSYRELLVGTDAFKIPVLYEHEKEAKWIGFTMNPADLEFNRTVLQYAAITAAGYGMTLSDIGLGTSERALAAVIRDERKSRRQGFGTLLVKLQELWTRILPDELEFVFIHDDVETLVARSRALLASSRAFREMIQEGVLWPDQVLEQLMADGLITVQIDPKRGLPQPLAETTSQFEQAIQEKEAIGDPVPPSQGGQGEIKNRS